MYVKLKIFKKNNVILFRFIHKDVQITLICNVWGKSENHNS
jgi:hypothetical protein